MPIEDLGNESLLTVIGSDLANDPAPEVAATIAAMSVALVVDKSVADFHLPPILSRKMIPRVRHIVVLAFNIDSLGENDWHRSPQGWGKKARRIANTAMSSQDDAAPLPEVG